MWAVVSGPNLAEKGVHCQLSTNRNCPIHFTAVNLTQNKRQWTKKRVRDKLEESVDHIIEVKDGTPVSKDVMKAAANIQGVRAFYNQASAVQWRMAQERNNRPVLDWTTGSKACLCSVCHILQTLIMSYLKHFQLRNEDSTVKAESDADQCLRRLGICPGIMRRSLRH
ncbi:hypothetical protein IV203_005356 [Nitzschia inconspicua]|uniref:Uncharacterized protein n=1 Tax=Nitzschia inconspicua TaxID=303405 RepID=A0A9K3PG94_9STRA|nr:hypothetical protein IV203_005356 [Nitzschia inconspicua]